MIIGLLAIMKAGGAYVPLDPLYASDRLTGILDDAAPAVIVADNVGRIAIGDVALSTRVVVDPKALDQDAINNPQIAQLTSRHLAYVIYTSGSTGKPKGVMIEHQGALRAVPLGAIGEMYIGGVGVARGYLNMPQLTNERFLPDPFAVEAGARMYKTGDLARYLLDGNLVFLGRNDHQVKIRGFRIELGEIEARLTEHPIVSEAVVVALGEETNRRLVAYV
ncbi:hypothetical protein BGX21_006525, partial [Mortierella sp. AD011]